MASKANKSTNSKILEVLTREENLVEVEACDRAPAKIASTVTSTGPKWQVKESKATPFVNDFFFSHPDKILGI